MATERFSVEPPKMRAWRLPDDNLDITYVKDYDRRFPHTFLAHHTDTQQHVGNLYLDKEGGINAVETRPEFRRKGIATNLLEMAQHAASEDPEIPTPKHSASRTASGDKWAKAVGGELPKRSVISNAQFRGQRWE